MSSIGSGMRTICKIWLHQGRLSRAVSRKTQLPGSVGWPYRSFVLLYRADPPDGPRPMVLSDLWAPRSVRITLSLLGTTLRACGHSQPWQRHLSLAALPLQQAGACGSSQPHPAAPVTSSSTASPLSPPVWKGTLNHYLTPSAHCLLDKTYTP